MGADIIFPHLGITIENLPKGINIFGFNIAFYGLIIACGMLLGYLVALWQARRTGQDGEMYLDLALWGIVFAVIGARAYYVIFSWDYYGKHPSEIINIRGGGLAIYGGIIAGVLTAFVFSKIKKVSFWKLADTGCAGLLTGQIIGRWGNFFNREAFGTYTDNIFAMQIKKSDVLDSNITERIARHLVNIDGVQYIQVHPTFLYESLWNLCVLIIILCFTKKKKFEGQLFDMYLCGYGMGRIWIEALRTDQLKLFGTGIAVSQLLSLVLVVLSATHMAFHFAKLRRKRSA